MKKVLTKVLLFIIGVTLVLSPFAVFFIVTSKQNHIYSKTYYAALVDKVHHLESLKKEKKIILIGGSNVAFGFNSKLLEEEFPEYKVVNFGLYAMLGTKIMVDLAEKYINEGDMVFVLPEIDSQSTSLYFNADATLKALEDDIKIVKDLPKDNLEAVMGEYYNFVKERGKQKEAIEPSGVYQRKNFNDYGDISYEEKDSNNVPYRSVNRMVLHYNPTMMVDYNYKVDSEFFTYLNEFSKTVQKRKATTYYAFSPVNELSVINKEKATDYYWSIRENLSFDVIGNPSEYIIDPHYFYDSNFHLNDAGAILRTYYLAKDIYRDILHISKTPKFSIPEAPDYIEPIPEETEDDPNAIYFKLEEEGSGYKVVGVADGALAQTELRLPKVYNHKYVTGISKNAFVNSKLQKITIPNSYHYFENGAFDNCLSIKRVYLETTTPSELIVDYLGGLVSNVSSDFKFAVPSVSLNDYLVDYNWQFYKAYLMGYDYASE